ncbi:MAG: hypothetical protein RL213_1969 [Bacteroidota bacterium]
MSHPLRSFRKKTILLASATGLFLLWGFHEYPPELSKQLDIFSALFREVNTVYVDTVDAVKLMDKGVSSMLESLDPYTTYIPESDKESYRAMTTGRYGGIGAVIRLRGDRIVISEPYEGFPAQKAGLRAGDELLEVDGLPMRGKRTEEVSRMLKGTPGTEVRLKVRREGLDNDLAITLKREEVKVKSVPFHAHMEDGIAYVKLVNFTDKCSKDLENALKALDKEKELRGLVLDLRGNPGGLLQEAVEVSGLFLEKGQEVVSTRGRMPDANSSYKTSRSPFNSTLPVVVLVNSSSASASEIVAGCLQDLDRAVILGQRTYGKGLVQTTRQLGYDAQLKVTTAKYYIPSGRCIQAVDYSHRNPDGSVGKVPDSLQHTFKTRAGREVRDGGGIQPDFSTESTHYSAITTALINRNLVFDYATYYRTRHDSAPDPQSFEEDEAVWTDFNNYLRNKEYGYITKTEESLEALKHNAEEEDYFERIGKDYEALRNRLNADKKNDLEKHRDEIRKVLEEEIMTRYYYQSGRTAASLEHDRDVREALRILQSPSRYRNLLTADD